MADRPEQAGTEPEDPALSIAARHALHDEESIAAFATDGDDADDAARSKSLTERCSACRALYEDVVAIGGALRASGNAARIAETEPAPRSFRLTPADADRLRPGTRVVRLRDRIAAALGALGRPLGMSMAALGVVGLLLGTFTLGGGTALAPVPEDVGMSGGGADASGGAVRSSGPSLTVQPVSGQTREPGERTAGSPLASQLFFASASPDAETPADRTPSEAPGPSLLVLGGSIVVLATGIGLFVLGSRRREPDRER